MPFFGLGAVVPMSAAGHAKLANAVAVVPAGGFQKPVKHNARADGRRSGHQERRAAEPRCP